MLRISTAIAVLAAAGHVANPANLIAQQQPSLTGTLVDSISVREGDPVGALWRSAIVPGWGQAYNGQIYKTPIVMGVIGTLVGFAVYSNGQFHEFNEAYLYGVYIDEDPHPFPEYEESFNMYPGYSTSTLRSQRDSYRRSRNLFIIGTVLAYGLNILDAYVNGQLIGFDVGEDLQASVGFGSHVAGPSLRLRF